MQYETMTVTQALTELKLLGKRIEKTITDGTYISAVQEKTSAKSVADITADIKSSWQRANDLITRYNAIKGAVAASNATATVVVGTNTYTVAMAIDAKAHFQQYKKKLLETLTAQTRSAYNNYTNMVNKVEKDAMTLVRQSGEDVSNSEAVKSLDIYKNYMQANAVTMVDPLNLDELLVKMADDIDQFALNVDTALSVANATTTIYIGYNSDGFILIGDEAKNAMEAEQQAKEPVTAVAPEAPASAD